MFFGELSCHEEEGREIKYAESEIMLNILMFFEELS